MHPALPPLERPQPAAAIKQSLFYCFARHKMEYSGWEKVFVGYAYAAFERRTDLRRAARAKMTESLD